MASKKHFSNQEFLASAQEYLPLDAAVKETDAKGGAGKNALKESLSENTFYCFDAEAATAFGHAIEDLALEEANGSLLGAFQDFEYFEPHRERYCQLAATIDRVEVLAAGKTAKLARRIRFFKDAKGSCKDFFIVLYQGKRRQAVFVGRQSNRAHLFEEKKFIGFYTFNPRLIGLLRQDVMELHSGLGTGLREFTRQQVIDQAAKQLKSEFSRQEEAVDQAVRRLQLGGRQYGAGKFASDLEKGLSRLYQWKTRMPKMLARAEGP